LYLAQVNTLEIQMLSAKRELVWATEPRVVPLWLSQVRHQALANMTERQCLKRLQVVQSV